MEETPKKSTVDPIMNTMDKQTKEAQNKEGKGKKKKGRHKHFSSSSTTQCFLENQGQTNENRDGVFDMVWEEKLEEKQILVEEDMKGGINEKAKEGEGCAPPSA